MKEPHFNTDEVLYTSNILSLSDLDMQIRFAKNSDVNQIDTLEKITFDYDLISKRQIARLIHSKSADVIVATIQNQIVGYLIGLRRKNARVARLYSIAIHPAYRSKGIASQLMVFYEKIAAKTCNIMRLQVKEANTHAIQIYQKKGYRLIGRKEHYYTDQSTALIMERHIKTDK